MKKSDKRLLLGFIGLCLMLVLLKNHSVPPAYGKFSQEKEQIDLDWNLDNPVEKSQINLRDFEDQVIFINIWAEWCGPCRREMSSIQNLYNQFEDRVVFVSVVFEYSPETQEYIEESGFTFPVYEARPPRSYNFQTFPTTFILDRNGKVAMRTVGEYKWDGEDIVTLLENLYEAQY